MTIKTYQDLIRLPTFEERFTYLQQGSTVGASTFGSRRYLNQRFYASQKWRRIRDKIVLRDMGCDLGIQGYEIFDQIVIHHLNPLTPYDIEHETKFLTSPEFLICVSEQTHKAIHYGDSKYLDSRKIVVRSANDTSPWRR